MFTNTETGEKIQDKNYAIYYRCGERARKAAAAKAARLIVVADERDEVAELAESIGDDVADVDAFHAYSEAYYAHEVAEWAGNVTVDEVKAMVDGFEDAFSGTWQSEREYTEELIEEGIFGEMEGILSGYLDVESLTRDLFVNDYLSLNAPGGLVWVFQNL